MQLIAEIHIATSRNLSQVHLVFPTGGSGLGVLRGDDPEVELLANAF